MARPPKKDKKLKSKTVIPIKFIEKVLRSNQHKKLRKNVYALLTAATEIFIRKVLEAAAEQAVNDGKTSVPPEYLVNALTKVAVNMSC